MGDFDSSTAKVFVAGATGYTGRALVEELCSRGVKTVAHIRPDSPRLDTLGQSLEAFGAEIDSTAWDLEAMSKTMEQRQPTHVFSCLGTTKARMRKVERLGGNAEAQSYRAVDYGLPKMLMEAVVKGAKTARYIYLSSMGVKEDTGIEYLEVRWCLERELRESGLDYVIARPCFISGQDRQENRPMERIGATVIDGMLSVVGLFGSKGQELRQRYRSMTGHELARGLIAHAFSPDSVGRVIESEQLQARSKESP